MNRCTSTTFLYLAAAFSLLAAPLALLPTSAGAQTIQGQSAVRPFPAAARRGEMVVKAPPFISLNGKAEQLSPGARIFSQNNLVVLSGQLVDRPLTVNYLRDGSGQIQQVWILTAEEAKEKRPGSDATIFNFLTGGDAPAADGKQP